MFQNIQDCAAEHKAPDSIPAAGTAFDRGWVHIKEPQVLKIKEFTNKACLMIRLV